MKETVKDVIKVIVLAVGLSLVVVSLAGCSSTGKAITKSASGKNLGLDGWVMFGKIEAANPETGTPQGEMIVGRLSYKSRRVGIPGDQKVPTTGNFKATKTKSLFGTEETIIEYDFTAGSDADAKAALEAMEKKAEAAAKEFTEVKSGK